MAIYHPPTFINKYLQEKLALDGFGAVPMYPTMPSDFSIANDFSLDVLLGNSPSQRYSFQGQAAIYDRMFRMRRKPFPHIKSEQLLYYFYALTTDAVVNLIDMTQQIQDLLDRGDESAQELNAWSARKQASDNPIRNDAGEIMPLPFFHDIKVYQLQETRDIIDFATARTYAGNKLIIDYDWHKSS